MYVWIKPVLKDTTRLFGSLEKELVYYRDKKRCQLPGCGAEVLWGDAEFHHVEMHSMGGQTTLDNGALVHAACHPKSAKSVADFAEFWKKKREGIQATTTPAVPVATESDGE